MKEKTKTLIIWGVVLVILLLPIIINAVNNKRIETISYDDYTTSMQNSAFSVVYFGDLNNDKYESIKASLINARNKWNVPIQSVDTTSLTADQKNELIEKNSNFNNENTYAFIRDGELIYVGNDLTEKRMEQYIDKYVNGTIPSDELAYKTVSTYKEYMKIVDGKKITMSVFGRNSCSWCNKFKPVYNDIAGKYKLDIYYFDSDSYNSNEYSKILNSGLIIPGSCTETKEEKKLSEGFGTPLTLFTKQGKVIDCISGYTNETGLLAKLKSVGMIK